MSSLAKCKQCGEVLPISNFRRYYHGDGHYKVCAKCETLNSRAKYLTRKGAAATQAEKSELAKIEQLYEYQRLAGLSPPRRRKEHQRAIDELNRLLKTYETSANVVPEELQTWLDAELTEEPEYYIDTVYEHLIKRYKPVLGLAQDTLTPVYDETYTVVLNQILERFNAYEDKYYS